MLGTAIASAAAAATMTTAIVTTDHAVLRASPRDAAPQQGQLWQGEVLEVRGERLDYLQVWDHARERGGYVKASQVRRTALTPEEAPDLLAVLRFLRDAPGAESLDALGTMAQRLALRASSGAAANRQAQATLSAHLEVAARYGVKFASYEQDGRVRLCYEGEAFRRVLTLPATPRQQAQAVLALTAPECIDPALTPLQRHAANTRRAEVLERVELANLPAYLRQRVALRRASVWSTLAYEHARLGEGGQAQAQRAVDALASVRKGELVDEDQAAYNDAAMRVNASRWAAVPAVVAAADRGPAVVTQPGQPGETCVLLVDAKHDAASPLARRCTYALVWPQSASVNREGNALALAVQPLEAWRELWLFRRRGAQWTIDVLPPATLSPELGYAEFAGWVPGGQQVLVAREARGEGRYRRSQEVVSLESLTTQRTAADMFQRWQDPEWRKMSVAVR